MVQLTGNIWFKNTYALSVVLYMFICSSEESELMKIADNYDAPLQKEIHLNDILEENKKSTTYGLDMCPLRIHGGVEASIDLIPFQIGLRRTYFSSYWIQFCGGALVTMKHVLTAAHCLVLNSGNILNLADVRVVAGSIRSDAKEEEMKKEIWRRIKYFWRHKYYKMRFYRDDFGVIEVEYPFIKTDTIKPIRMHTNDANVKLKEDDECLVSGYGETEDGEYPIHLRIVCVPIVTLKICKSFYPSGFIHNGVFCAGIFGRDSCKGDSGGPIVCHGMLAGLVSFGGTCGRSPGVYVRLSGYTANALLTTESITSSHGRLNLSIYLIVMCLSCFH